MTFQEWIQRYVGAYVAFGGTDEEALESVADYDSDQVDPNAECPVESARCDYAENNESLVA